MQIFKKKPIILICIIGMCFMVFAFLNKQRSQKLPQKVYGKPQIIHEEVKFNQTNITQILDDGIHMYVLADHHQGYIQVYDLNGQYQATWSFWDSMNGAFSMAVEDEMLYVKDPTRNIYIFSNCQFQQFVPLADADTLFGDKDFDNFSDRYEIRFGSIWRIDLQEPVCVVSRGIKGFVYQYHLNFVFVVILLLVIMIIVRRGRFVRNIKRNTI